jgi:predicted enzyme related to lactoylglutathione lyase
VIAELRRKGASGLNERGGLLVASRRATVAAMRITKTYFMVPVQEMDRALAFYGEVLGLKVVFSSPDWSELSWRDATIALHRGGNQAESQGWLGFEVDDLDSAIAEIVAAGGRREMERTEGGIRLVTVTDPEGNTLTIGAQPSGGGWPSPPG